MSRGFDPAYAPTGEALVRAGEAVTLALRLETIIGSVFVAESLEDRVFKQRILDGVEQLIEIDGEIEADGDGDDMVLFAITSEQTADLLEEGETIRDLRHLVVEIVARDDPDPDDEFDILSPQPFRVRA